MIASTERQRNTPPAEFRRNDEAARRIFKQAAATSSRAAAVLQALHAHANASGKCYPSQHQIAEITGQSTRTVRRATRELEQLGLIQITRGTGHQSSRYQICYPAVDRGHSPIENRPPQESPRRAPATPQAARPQNTLAIFESPETLRQAAQQHGMSELALLLALQTAKQQRPKQLDAYLGAVIANHKSGARPLPPVDAETKMDLRADLQALHSGRAIA